MPSIKHRSRTKLPRRFAELVRELPPQAILDDIHYENRCKWPRCDKAISGEVSLTTAGKLKLPAC